MGNQKLKCIMYKPINCQTLNSKRKKEKTTTQSQENQTTKLQELSNLSKYSPKLS